MQMIVQTNSVYFFGQIKDLTGFLAAWPPQLTLAEFISLNLQ